MFEGQFISFFIVLLTAVFFSALFARLHLPWAVSLIIAGIIVGPYSLGIFEPNETIIFMGEIGLVFLMFMAGLEMRFSSFRKQAWDLSFIALLNAGIPFAVGALIALAFGFSGLTALLLGLIFVSSAVAVIVPALSANNLLHTKIGNTIIGYTMLQDIASLVLVSIFFQTSAQNINLPLPLFYLLILIFLIFLRFAIPKISRLFTKIDFFQQELRSVFMILIGTVIVFELLGLHPIIAGFFAGLALSDSVQSRLLKEKISAISYGLFIPIFFIVVGAQTDLIILQSGLGALLLIGAIVIGSMTSKFSSGFIAAKIVGFTNRESSLIGASSLPQLSITLAVAFTGLQLGLVNQEIIAGLIALTIVSTIVSPIAISFIMKSFTPKKLEAVAEINTEKTN